MNPSGGITSPTKHPTEPTTCVESDIHPNSGCSTDEGEGSRGQSEVQVPSPPRNTENSANLRGSVQGSDPPFENRLLNSSILAVWKRQEQWCAKSFTPTGDVTVMDTEMDGLKHTANPANIQVLDNGYGMFSPRKDRNDIQSIVWDSSNGHYNLSGGIQGCGTAPKVCLDYNYCIEYVESDDENGTTQFFAAQMKVGMPKVPNPTFSQSSK
ncbi:hypothetical protein L1987_61371 [Smallanthus sonchifolius]|uniref:Uncharacterized protein n=1 Tax=Smallanthus sonchifolius TaxID=185202 RepID=A0ACB9DB07_9ASTR|nr:hypothetical protein L1987_61371 [Smallanthus sonchifolius]